MYLTDSVIELPLFLGLTVEYQPWQPSVFQISAWLVRFHRVTNIIFASKTCDCQSGSWAAQASGGTMPAIMNLDRHHATPAVCPSGWSQIGYNYVRYSDGGDEERRTCLSPTGKSCSVAYLLDNDNGSGAPPACPTGWTQADYATVAVSNGYGNMVRTCFICQ